MAAVCTSMTPSCMILIVVARTRPLVYLRRSSRKPGICSSPLSRSHHNDATTRAVSSPFSSRARYVSSESTSTLASWNEVTPKPFRSLRARRSPSCLSCAVYGGALRLTRFMAESCRLPTGSPVRGSRSMRPPGGSGVSFVLPASDSALLLPQAEWPSLDSR